MPRAPKATRSVQAAAPWWLDAGSEECGCGGSYAFEAEVRCVQCDDAMCATCVTWVRRRAYCAGCVPNTKAGKRAS